jgi:hypothetical protein
MAATRSLDLEPRDAGRSSGRDTGRNSGREPRRWASDAGDGRREELGSRTAGHREEFGEGRRGAGARSGVTRARDEGRTRGAWSSHRRYAGAGRGRTPGSWSLDADSRTRGGTQIVERGEPGRGEERGARVELEPAPIGTLMRVGTLMQCGMGN